jgi:hypothetical protein
VSAEGETVSTEDGGKLMKGTKGINMCKKGEAQDIKRMFFTATQWSVVQDKTLDEQRAFGNVAWSLQQTKTGSRIDLRT